MSMYFLDGKGELFPYYDKLNLTHFDWFLRMFIGGQTRR